jgi:hypothetical protein
MTTLETPQLIGFDDFHFIFSTQINLFLAHQIGSKGQHLKRTSKNPNENVSFSTVWTQNKCFREGKMESNEKVAHFLHSPFPNLCPLIQSGRDDYA